MSATAYGKKLEAPRDENVGARNNCSIAHPPRKPVS